MVFTFVVSYVCFCVCMKSADKAWSTVFVRMNYRGATVKAGAVLVFPSLVLYRRMWDTCGTPSERNAEQLVPLLHLISLRLQAVAPYKVLVKVTHVELVLEDGKCRPDSLTNKHIA